MKWSKSAAQCFRRCQRQWYWRHQLASATARDPARREAYLLGKLQSIPQWRGRIVDDTISATVVRALREGRRITLSQALQFAMRRFDAQLATARAHRLRECGYRPAAKAVKDSFAAFHVMEYEGCVPEEEIVKARQEVKDALTAAFQMDEVKDLIKAGRQLIDQRSLSFRLAGVSVQAIPDLIVFFEDRSPLILDWKVHALGLFDAFQQLVLYAMALTRAEPHRDFPTSLADVGVAEVELMEVQLLSRTVRRHRATELDVAALEEEIADSAYAMRRLVNGRKAPLIDVNELEGAYGPEACGRCQYRKLCWQEAA